MLDGEVAEVLRVMEDGFPRVERMTGPEARRAIAARRVPSPNVDSVRAAADRVAIVEDHSVPVRVYSPHEAPGGPPRSRRIIVFFHGGGFVFCDVDSHDALCRELCANTDSVVVSVDYRLAPEHPAPAAALDAMAALRWASTHAAELGGDPHRVVVAGDSAGGNLAAVVCHLARDAGGPQISAQVLVYPVIDPALDTPSCRRYAAGYVNTTAAMRWYWSQYLPGGALPEPAHVAAPLRAPSHADLPPAIVITAGLDPLHDEGARYAQTLADAGVPVIHRDYAGLFHGFFSLYALRAGAAARSTLYDDLDLLIGPAAAQER